MFDTQRDAHNLHKPAREKPLRLHSLDSVRGIAALVVVFHHCLLSIPGWSESRPTLLQDGFSDPRAWVYLTPIRILVCGPSAVLVFFVLSGLVLAMTFIERDRDRYLPYVIKRVTRIWPTFAVAIIISAFLAQEFGQTVIPEAAGWFAYTWGSFPSTSLVLSHLAMLGNQIGLDNPMWSLVHEMRISLIFPALVFLTLARWRLTLLGMAVVSLGTTKLLGLYGNIQPIGSIGMTVEFAFLFVGGIVIASHIRSLRLNFAKLSRNRIALVWFIALFALSFPPESTEYINKLSNGVLLLISGAAAALVIILSTVEGRVLHFLLSPIPSYLGRISYSLYLIHVIVIAAVAHAFSGFAPFPALVAVGAIVSIPLADLFQRFIEVPTTNFGRRLARSLSN